MSSKTNVYLCYYCDIDSRGMSAEHYLTCDHWTLLSIDFMKLFKTMLLTSLKFVKIIFILIYPILRLKSEERHFGVSLMLLLAAAVYDLPT